MMDFEPIVKTVTKIVGTTFNNRQSLLARVRDEDKKTAFLELDPANPYDPDAVIVVTQLRDGSEVILGHIQNGDRLCLGVLPNGKACEAIIDGGVISKSRTVKCPNCSKMFFADKTNTVLVPDDPDRKKIVSCSCGTRFAFGLHNIYVHNCGCSEFARVGLASRIAECMRSGIVYTVQILEVTGGEVEDGKQRSLGCNIRLEALNALVEV
jgi:hypothetical protein